MPKNRKILNAIYIVIVILTLIFGVNEFFDLKNEFATLRQTNGEGYYVAELFMLILPVCFLLAVAIETSIYSNLRYFFFNRNKTTLQTVFQALMMSSGVCLLLSGFVPSVAPTVLFALIIVLILLRIIYVFIKKS